MKIASPAGQTVKALSLLYNYLRRLEPIRGGKLVTDARDQHPLEPGVWSCSLRAFLCKPPCGTCKKEAGWY